METISWKKKIKYLQISILIALVVLYFMIWYFNKQKNYFKVNRNILQQKEVILNNLKDEKNKIDLMIKRIKDIRQSNKLFIESYNKCYALYSKKNYLLSWENYENSLKDCMYKNWYEKEYIKNMTDDNIQKILIWLWVLKNNNTKMEYPQTAILSSLDKNIFNDKMEKKLDFISFWLPNLIDKKLWLYTVDFSIKTKVNYSLFKDILWKMQNKMFINNPIYYNVKWISAFDITQNKIQDLLIQGNFYYIK